MLIIGQGRNGVVKMAKKGLYANIHKKRKSGKPMRKKGQKGAPTDADFKRAAKTAKKKTRKRGKK